MQISIHTGPVISGVVGDSKPQFTLIGEAVTKTIRLCQVAEPLKVTCSKETLRYLQLYTNNLQFKRTFVEMIDFGKEAIFEVSVMRGKSRSNMMKGDNIHDQEDIMKNDGIPTNYRHSDLFVYRHFSISEHSTRKILILSNTLSVSQKTLR